ncbi:hypothetical protein GCM10009848_29520 [Micromonospora lupini]
MSGEYVNLTSPDPPTLATLGPCGVALAPGTATSVTPTMIAAVPSPRNVFLIGPPSWRLSSLSGSTLPARASHDLPLPREPVPPPEGASSASARQALSTRRTTDGRSIAVTTSILGLNGAG